MEISERFASTVRLDDSGDLVRQHHRMIGRKFFVFTQVEYADPNKGRCVCVCQSVPGGYANFRYFGPKDK